MISFPWRAADTARTDSRTSSICYRRRRPRAVDASAAGATSARRRRRTTATTMVCCAAAAALGLFLPVARAFAPSRSFTSSSSILKPTMSRSVSLQRAAEAQGISFPTLFDLQLPCGRCIVVQLPKILDRLATAGKGGVDSNSTGDGIAVASQELLQEEVDCALSLPDPIRLTFVGGRLAMRRALMCFGVSPPPILRNSHGAPQLPASFMGSISHKRTVAVAVAAPRVSLDGREWPRNIGVDIEMLGGAGRRRKLGQRVLREDEIRGLGSIPGVSEDDEVLLRFSLKEAIYKALHPHVRRLVSFKEAAVHPSESGKCRVDLSLANQEGPFRADAAWRRLQIPSGPGNALEDYVLTWAVIEPQI